MIRDRLPAPRSRPCVRSGARGCAWVRVCVCVCAWCAWCAWCASGVRQVCVRCASGVRQVCARLVLYYHTKGMKTHIRIGPDRTQLEVTPRHRWSVSTAWDHANKALRGHRCHIGRAPRPHCLAFGPLEAPKGGGGGRITYYRPLRYFSQN